MTARDGLFLISGFCAALMLGLVYVVAYLAPADAEVKQRIATLQRALDDERVRQALAQNEAAAKHQSELAKVRQAEEQTRAALENARQAAAATMKYAESAIAAIKAQAEAQRKADEARTKVESKPEQPTPPRAEQAVLIPSGLFEQAANLEQSGNGAEAVRVYVRAARTGDGKAANRLGQIYDKGIPGVPSNYAESLKWCYTARALGEMPNCAAR